MAITVVASLPVLNQSDFPAMPEVPNDRTLLCFDTEWQNTEKELAACCVVNACIRVKQWQPVHADQCAAYMKAHPMIAPFMTLGVANALWMLVNDGFIEAVRYQDTFYFVPTPRLANAVLADNRKLRLV